MEETKIQRSSLAGLKSFQDAGLIQPIDEGKDIELCSSWPNAVKFDEDGFVVLVDFGGKRLYKGLPCSPEVFSNFDKLGALNLAGTDLKLSDMMKVLEQVSSKLKTLYVGGNGLGVNGAKELGAWLPSASNLVTLDLRYNDVGGEGMEAICAGLKGSKVQHLYAEGNQLGDQGAIAISSLLKDENGGSSIKEIFLGANLVQSEGAASLAESLKTNKNISKIYLEGNNIGFEGAQAFTNVLESLDGNTGLKNLFVDNNNIGKEGSQKLAKALNSQTAIGESLFES